MSRVLRNVSMDSEASKVHIQKGHQVYFPKDQTAQDLDFSTMSYGHFVELCQAIKATREICIFGESRCLEGAYRSSLNSPRVSKGLDGFLFNINTDSSRS